MLLIKVIKVLTASSVDVIFDPSSVSLTFLLLCAGPEEAFRQSVERL